MTPTIDIKISISDERGGNSVRVESSEEDSNDFSKDVPAIAASYPSASAELDVPEDGALDAPTMSIPENGIDEDQGFLEPPDDDAQVGTQSTDEYGTPDHEEEESTDVLNGIEHLFSPPQIEDENSETINPPVLEDE